MTPARLAGVVVAVLAALGVAAASRLPLRFHQDDEALLRLSWSARPERIEVCRRLTPGELAARLPHMRQEEICEGRSARYVLTVEVDGSRIAEDTLQGGGARRDRPLYVLRSFPLSPGSRQVGVRLTRLDSIPEDVRGAEGSRAVPPLLGLDTTVVVTGEMVLLVTLDPERRSLRLHAGPAREGRHAIR